MSRTVDVIYKCSSPKSDNVEKMSSDLSPKSDNVEKISSDLSPKSDNVEKMSSDLSPKSDNVEKMSESLPKCDNFEKMSDSSPKCDNPEMAKLAKTDQRAKLISLANTGAVPKEIRRKTDPKLSDEDSSDLETSVSNWLTYERNFSSDCEVDVESTSSSAVMTYRYIRSMVPGYVDEECDEEDSEAASMEAAYGSNSDQTTESLESDLYESDLQESFESDPTELLESDLGEVRNVILI